MSDQKFAGDYPAGTEQAYRAYWAALTGKSPSEIYVPEALRAADAVGSREGSE